MKMLRTWGTILIVALVALGIWMASTGARPGRQPEARSETPVSAYDYEARDVLVQQMSADGTLQYELEAKHISQLPSNGQISAEDLVIHHDPAGSAPGGTNRLTLTAQRADLPESGDQIKLQGKVRAQGRPLESRALMSFATEQLTYDMRTQEVFNSMPVDFTWGGTRLHFGSLRWNIKQGTFGVNGTSPVESNFNGILVP